MFRTDSPLLSARGGENARFLFSATLFSTTTGKEEIVRKFNWTVASVVVLLFLPGTRTQAQDKEDPGERFSVQHLDMENESRGPTSQEGNGAVQVGPNVRVNDTQQPFPNGLLGRSETTSATDADGKLVLVGFNDAQGFCGAPFGVACTPQNPPGLSGFGFSTDGGLTFTDGGAPPVINHIFTRGDPWIDRGGFDNETFFYANLSVDDRPGPPPAFAITDLGVSIHRGHFNGGTFVFEDVRVFNAPNAPDDFYDKEAIAVSKDESGAAYVSLTNFIKTCRGPQAGFGQIEVWRTHDAGNTYHGPVVVSPDQTDTPCTVSAGGILQQSSVPAIGPRGEVYVVFQFGPHLVPTSTDAQIRVARSLDGGVTFNAPVKVADINTMRNNPPVGYSRDRINDHPRIAVATSGPHRGRVFVVFYSAVAPVTAAPIALCPSPPFPAGSRCRDQRLTSSQVFASFSDDQGLTWSTPVPVAPDVPATGVKRFWPVVTVGSYGAVHVIYYESQEVPTASNPFCTIGVGGGLRRRGTANSLADTFFAQSLDGGATFGDPVKVSSATSNWCTAASDIRPNFGDYIGSSFGEQRLFPTWADSRNGVVDTFAAQVKVED
jgi:hypothetical protein